jgi:hypothetical protein
MPYLNDCQEILHRLIADGDTSGIPLAEQAINEYLDATPANARKSGLRSSATPLLEASIALLMP